MWRDSVAYERFVAGEGVAVFTGCFGEYDYEAGAAGEGGFRGCLRKISDGTDSADGSHTASEVFSLQILS